LALGDLLLLHLHHSFDPDLLSLYLTLFVL